MRRHYTRTFAGMGVVLAAVAAAAFLANGFAADARARHQRLRRDAEAGGQRRLDQQTRTARINQAIEPVRAFAAEWKTVARLPEKQAAEKIRSDIEAIAQRQLALVTDNAITPQPDRYLFQGLPVRVQRVTLRASGKDLAALLTWLGKVEERYPAAVVELCEFSSNVGGNTGLTVRLVQPLQEPASRALLLPASTDTAALPELISAVPWLQYVPARLKTAGAVGFQRNPLQPAVASDVRPLPLLRADADEITPRLEAALDGRVRSVIRGASPLIVIDGKIFRVGDELVLGTAREKPVPEAKTKLKQIGDDRLVFQVSGGTMDKPLQCEVLYALPAFLKAR